MARNGHLAEDGIVLVTVEDNDQLIPTAAAAFFAARAAAAADGVRLIIVEPAGAYRSAFVQNDMVDHPENYNLNSASSIGFSRSGQSHGWGNRIDVNSAAVSWMLRRGGEFGWIREYGARDPNHFKHDGTTAIAGAAALAEIDQQRKRKPTMRETQIYQMKVGGVLREDYSRVGADVLPVGSQAGGCEITTDKNVARQWARQISGPDYPIVQIERADYIAAQEFGRREYALHRADDVARIREALGAGGTGGGSVSLQPVLDAIAAGEAQDAKDVAALLTAMKASDSVVLAAIKAADENDLAKWGLKRA